MFFFICESADTKVIIIGLKYFTDGEIGVAEGPAPTQLFFKK